MWPVTVFFSRATVVATTPSALRWTLCLSELASYGSSVLGFPFRGVGSGSLVFAAFSPNGRLSCLALSIAVSAGRSVNLPMFLTEEWWTNGDVS